MKTKYIRNIFSMLMLLPSVALAENLDSPAPPNDPANAMSSTEDIDNRLDTSAAQTKETELTSSPDSTECVPSDVIVPAKDNINGAQPSDVASGKTYWGLTDDNWGLQTGTGTLVTFPAPVAKTGQTISYGTQDDGVYQKGATASPRFTDNDNGTVTDNLTGLIWTKNANCLGEMESWKYALFYVLALKDGSCGLSDGSRVGDWRLPNVKELQSLIEFSQANPALPSDHPFSGVQSSSYWSATTRADDLTNAWIVNLNDGFVNHFDKTFMNYVWPVRGGQ